MKDRRNSRAKTQGQWAEFLGETLKGKYGWITVKEAWLGRWVGKGGQFFLESRPGKECEVYSTSQMFLGRMTWSDAPLRKITGCCGKSTWRWWEWKPKANALAWVSNEGDLDNKGGSWSTTCIVYLGGRIVLNCWWIGCWVWLGLERDQEWLLTGAVA